MHVHYNQNIVFAHPSFTDHKLWTNDSKVLKLFIDDHNLLEICHHNVFFQNSEE